MSEEAQDRSVALLIVGMEFALDDCKDQLYEMKTVLKIQGVTITDTLIEDPERGKILGIIPR